MYVFEVSGHGWLIKDRSLQRDIWRAMEHIRATNQWKKQVGLTWSDSRFWALSLSIPLLAGWVVGVLRDWAHYPVLSSPLTIESRLATILIWWPFGLLIGWIILAAATSIVISLAATVVAAAWRVIIRILMLYGRSRELIVAHPS